MAVSHILSDLDATELSKFGDGIFIDGLAFDGLSDPYGDVDPMGSFGVLACMQNNISRQEMDEYTLRSYQNAVAAMKSKKLEREIVKVPGTDLEDDEEVVARGEQMSQEVLENLKPAFKLPKKYQSWTKEQFEQQNVCYNFL